MKLINRLKFFLNIRLFVLFFTLTSCSEATFLVNSAKRVGTWGDEPSYKIGKPYVINGKWYYPAVDYQYDEIGFASWYGPGFHGKTTANGEIFDQNKISAAHRTLPLPSIVRVTNLENGKVLTKVRINDRGPFAKNRIIDLSKKAAKELGFLKRGVTKVRVEILEEESRELALLSSNDFQKQIEPATVKEITKKDITSSNEGDFEKDKKILKKNTSGSEPQNDNSILGNKELEIQVGAFTDHRNAKSLIEKLSEFKAYIKREFVESKYLYRVRIGPIENINQANQIQEKLYSLGYTTSHLVMN